MNLKTKIKDLCSYGAMVITKSGINYGAYSAINNTNVIIFGLGKSKEEAIKDLKLKLSPVCIYSDSEAIVEVIMKKPKLLKVGDKVNILEVAKECEGYEDWSSEMKEMIGGTFEIKSVTEYAIGIYYYIFNKDKKYYYAFPPYCVIPAFGEEDQIQKAIELLERAGRIKNGKVIV